MNNKQKLAHIKSMATEALEHRIGDSHTEYVLELIIQIVEESIPETVNEYDDDGIYMGKIKIGGTI